MLDEEAMGRAFRDVHRIWIEPELQRRRDRGGLPDGFKIRRCLILMPHGAEPIVQFNEEIGWEGVAQLGGRPTVSDGDPVYLTQVAGVSTVKPPEVDGERVAFIFLAWAGQQYRLIFDATPNLPPEHEVDPPPADDWAIGKAIAECINDELAERAVALHATVQGEAHEIGLWAAPALVPYPLAAISEKCGAGDLDAARALLVEHCSPDFLEQRVATWESNAAFRTRAALFQEALWAHRNEKYALSVSTLTPQVEGIATEWLHAQAVEVPWRHESKVQKLRDTLLTQGRLWGAGAGMARSLIAFFTDGPMFQDFREWFDELPDGFPNRHAVGHGRFEARYFTAEMSAKTFLLLDTLHYLFDADEGARTAN